MAAKKKEPAARELPAVDMRGNVAVGQQRKTNRRLMIVKEPFADGHGPAIVGKVYWFDKKEADGMEKSGVLESKAAEIAEYLKGFGVLGIVIDDATDPEMATRCRRAGLSIHRPETK